MTQAQPSRDLLSKARRKDGEGELIFVEGLHSTRLWAHKIFTFTLPRNLMRVINYPHHPPGENEAKRGWSKLLQPTIALAFIQIGNRGEAGFELRSPWHQGPCSASYTFILTNQQREKTEWSPSTTPSEFCHIFQQSLLALTNESSHSVIHTSVWITSIRLMSELC